MGSQRAPPWRTLQTSARVIGVTMFNNNYYFQHGPRCLHLSLGGNSVRPLDQSMTSKQHVCNTFRGIGRTRVHTLSSSAALWRQCRDKLVDEPICVQYNGQWVACRRSWCCTCGKARSWITCQLNIESEHRSELPAVSHIAVSLRRLDCRLIGIPRGTDSAVRRRFLRNPYETTFKPL